MNRRALPFHDLQLAHALQNPECAPVQAAPTDLVSGEPRLVDEEYAPPSACSFQRRDRTSWTGANDNHVPVGGRERSEVLWVGFG